MNNHFPIRSKEPVTSHERIEFIFSNLETKMNKLYEYIMNPDKRELLNKTYFNKRNI